MICYFWIIWIHFSICVLDSTDSCRHRAILQEMIVHEERGGSSPSSRRLWAPFKGSMTGEPMENDFGCETPSETPSISIHFSNVLQWSMRISGSNWWRYVSTICLAIFSGDIPWNLGLKYIGHIYMVGTSNLGSWNGHWNGIIYHNGINHYFFHSMFLGIFDLPRLFSTVVAPRSPRIRCSVTGRLEGCHCPDRGEHQGAVWWCRGRAMWPGLARGTFQETSQHPFQQGMFDGCWWFGCQFYPVSHVDSHVDWRKNMCLNTWLTVCGCVW